MAIKKVAKAIAGGIVSVAALWFTHFTGLTLPAEVTDFASAGLTTAVVGGLTALAVFFVPNEPDAPDERT